LPELGKEVCLSSHCRKKRSIEKYADRINFLTKYFEIDCYEVVINSKEYLSTTIGDVHDSVERNLFGDGCIHLKYHCSDCGAETIRSIAQIEQGNVCSCRSSSMSGGARIIKQWLKNNKIIYNAEYCLNNFGILNCRYRFDFYLPKLNVAIEYDGEQHFKPIEYFGGESEFIQRVRHDRDKDEIAERYGIKVIRIPYWLKDIPKHLDAEIVVHQVGSEASGT
jgi:hypothetical protein